MEWRPTDLARHVVRVKVERADVLRDLLGRRKLLHNRRPRLQNHGLDARALARHGSRACLLVLPRAALATSCCSRALAYGSSVDKCACTSVRAHVCS